MITSAITFLKSVSPLQKQLIKFTLIGITAVLVDLSCYYSFLNLLPEKPFGYNNEPIAKALSFLCGLTVTYFFNKRWTWKQSNHSKKRFLKFIFLYAVSLMVNVSMNSLFLYILTETPVLQPIPYKYFIAFVGATGISSLLNFMGQKFWVFKLKQVSEEDDVSELEIT